jgi:hypothetical protein
MNPNFENPNLQNLNEDSRGTTTHETHTQFLNNVLQGGVLLPGL